VLLRGGRPTRLLSARFISMFLQCSRILWRARRGGYSYILTFEGGWVSFVVALVQTTLMFSTPRHVILQFIMRERTNSLRSRLKYAFMKWCLSSVFLFVCSSRAECDYYIEAFGWPSEKVAYAPFHTDPAFLREYASGHETLVVSAGRTFRDYRTLLSAVAGSDIPLTIIASPSSIGNTPVPGNVTILYDLPLMEMLALIARSTIVVLPLEERRISIGQSVLLQAMAMAKAVVVTGVSGTVDYVEHMRTGILVPPRDAGALREAIVQLVSDTALRRRIGEAAFEQVRRAHLPDHYAKNVAALLRAGSSRFLER
jgi:glycosyltransferase involved in cell wall biosynthesis